MARSSAAQAEQVAPKLTLVEGKKQSKSPKHPQSFKQFNPWERICRPAKPVEEYTKKELGKEGEQLAAQFLRYKGYEIVETNWKCRAGEVDLIAKDKNEIVLCEVKTRLTTEKDQDDVVPELKVDDKKQERYRKLVLYYLMAHPGYTALRFDVISLTITGQQSAHLRHLISAFYLDC